MVRFSHRSAFSLAQNALTQALEAAQAAGRSVISLVESNPTAVGLSFSGPELTQLLHDERASTYAPEPFGMLSAREAVCADLRARGHEVSPDRVLLTASTSEAYAYIFRLLCNPGDSVLVPAPSYPLFDTLAQLEGVTLVPYRLRYDGEWHLDASELASEAARRAKAVITVHPNNPTGHYLKADELRALSRLGVPIVSDEVFADYALTDDDTRVASALSAAHDVPVFRLGGLSKSAALPQLKLAWTVVAGVHDFRAEALRRLEHIADAYLSPATPVQLALPRLLAAARPIQQRIRARCAHNLALLRDQLTEDTGASVLRVEGGWYAIVRLPEVLDEEAWVLALLERESVLVQPGYFFELGRGAFMVLSLITPEPDFAAGVKRLAARVRRTLA